MKEKIFITMGFSCIFIHANHLKFPNFVWECDIYGYGFFTYVFLDSDLIPGQLHPDPQPTNLTKRRVQQIKKK